MRVIVTRPAAQAAAWVDDLRAQGFDAVALPLIGIAPALDPGPLPAAWRELAAYRLVVFVSPNAAGQFFAARPDDVAPWPVATLAGSPGPGTTQVLAALGVPAAQIVAPAADAPQFDSESLWAALDGRDWRDTRVLIVRGDGGREWLADTLRGQGATVEMLSAYRREAPTWSAAEAAVLEAAIDAPEAHTWLFSSAEAIDRLEAATGPRTWTTSRAIASHPRIAERVRRLGFGSVSVVPPHRAAVVACLQSLAP